MQPRRKRLKESIPVVRGLCQTMLFFGDCMNAVFTAGTARMLRAVAMR